MKINKIKSVVLFSGGLDSSTLLYHCRANNFEPIALSFDYGQKHNIELNFAKKHTDKLKIDHRVIKIDTAFLSQSNCSLTNHNIAVEKSQLNGESDFISKKIPTTYVPARNLLLLSYATSFAESIGISNIFIGVNALDYSGYPDCRPDFIEQFQKVIDLATKCGRENNGIKIHTPLLNLTKSEIVKLGIKLGVDFDLTFSCYNPTASGEICNICDACVLREKGFREAFQSF